MIVRNKNDARCAFNYIKLVNDYKNQGSSKSLNAELYTVETKKSLRKFLKKESNERIVKDEGIDGYISLITLPEWIDNKDAAELYFENEKRLVCYPSQFDCTGQAFTCWYKLLKRRGRWMAYHCVRFDV